MGHQAALASEDVCSQRVHPTARLFRVIFRSWRPRGYMRLGTWMARLIPGARYAPVPFTPSVLWVDLASIDHQPVFLDNRYSWDVEERAIIPHLLQPGGIAIDVGANMGVYTLTCATAVGTQGLVLAYEPHAELLWRNTGGLPQVLVRPFAVTAEEGAVAFRHERANTYSHVVASSRVSRSDVHVRAVTLDGEASRLRLAAVDFIKVDVEGHEEAVFTGARELLQSDSPPVLMFEWFPDFRSRWKRGALATLADVAGSGWRVFRMGWGDPPRELLGWTELDLPATVVAVPVSRPQILKKLQTHFGLA